MRIRRPLVVGALAAIILFLPACTLGPIQKISVGNAVLGLQGASVTAPLTVTCQQGWNIEAYAVDVAQSTNLRLATGSGSVFNDFPGIPCTGSPQTFNVAVFDFSPWAFRRGTAAADGAVLLFNEVSGEEISKTSDPQEIHIRRANPQPSPSKAAQTTQDPRFPGHVKLAQ